MGQIFTFQLAVGLGILILLIIQIMKRIEEKKIEDKKKDEYKKY